MQLQGGLGSASTGFIIRRAAVPAPPCVPRQLRAVGSSTHFQLHFGAGLQIALTNHFFVRPQFDLHYVPNLTDQFGRNVVPEATIAVGYHFGER